MQFSINPSIDFSLAQKEEVIEINSNQTTTKRANATGTGDTTCQWTITNDPSLSFSPYMPFEIYLKQNTIGTTTGTALLDADYDALRSVAYLRIINSMLITINNVTIPCPIVNKVYPDTAIHYNKAFREYDPLGYPDCSTEYDKLVSGNGNPLAQFTNCESNEYFMRRGAYAPVSMTRGATAQSADWTLKGVIYIPGLLGYDQMNAPGLIGVRQIQISLQYDLSAKNLWSHALKNSAGTNAPTSITNMSFTTAGANAPILEYSTTRLAVGQPVPSRVEYPFFKYSPTHTYGGTLASGASTQIVGTSIQLTSVPKFVFLWVKENDAYKNISSTDTFCAINKVAIQFNNGDNLLGQCSPSTLHMFSQECGSLQSYMQFLGKAQSNFAIVGSQGSLLCLQFGKHISLGGNGEIQIGSQGSYQFQATVDCTNTGANQITNTELTYCVVYEEKMVIDNGNVSFISGSPPLVNGGAIVGGIVGGSIEARQVPYSTMVGGGFWGSLWNGIKNIGRHTKFLSTASTLLPGQFGKIAAPLIAATGYGVNESTGGARIGGSTATKAKMQSVLSKL